MPGGHRKQDKRLDKRDEGEEKAKEEEDAEPVHESRPGELRVNRSNKTSASRRKREDFIRFGRPNKARVRVRR